MKLTEPQINTLFDLHHSAVEMKQPDETLEEVDMSVEPYDHPVTLMVLERKGLIQWIDKFTVMRLTSLGIEEAEKRQADSP